MDKWQHSGHLFIGANLLLVANDKVAGDPMRQGLMDMAAPSGAQTRYFTIEKND